MRFRFSIRLFLLVIAGVAACIVAMQRHVENHLIVANRSQFTIYRLAVEIEGKRYEYRQLRPTDSVDVRMPHHGRLDIQLNVIWERTHRFMSPEDASYSLSVGPIDNYAVDAFIDVYYRTVLHSIGRPPHR